MFKINKSINGKSIRGKTFPILDVFPDLKNDKDAIRILKGKIDNVQVKILLKKDMKACAEVRSKNVIRIRHSFLMDDNKQSIHLCLLHEMVHLRQFRKGERVNSLNKKYCDNKHELEAYKEEIKILKRRRDPERWYKWYFTKYKIPDFLDEKQKSCLKNKLEDLWADKRVSVKHKP